MTRQVGQNQNLRRTYFYRPIRLGRQNILIDIFRFSVMSYKVTFYIPIFPQHKTARGISSWITIKKLRVLHGRKKFHFNMKWGKFLFRPIKWRSVKQVEHVTRMGDVIFLAKFQPEKHEYGWDSNNKKEGYKNSIWRHVLDSSGTGLGQVTDRCERDNSPSRYARLRTSWLLGELWNISVSSYLGRQKRN
jgi:hypothetical protein